MQLNREQSEFLQKRLKLLRSWRYVGPVMLLAIFGLAVVLKIYSPLLIDPNEVVERLEAGAIEQSSLEMMAVMLPVMLILVCLILVIFVILMYAAFSNEKKYLQILKDNESKNL